MGIEHALLPEKGLTVAGGTLNHALPVAMPAAMSVLPTPVEKAPSALVFGRRITGKENGIMGMTMTQKILAAHAGLEYQSNS